MLKITEIFRSIQGEGLDGGRPCCFVRLWGCNLNCVWCDTQYSSMKVDQEDQSGEAGVAGMAGEAVPDWRLMSVEQISDVVVQTGSGLVCVTGGEPLLQSETGLLLDKLVAEGLDVVLETNGSEFVGNLNPQVKRILDYKLVGSGCSGSFCEANWSQLTRRDQLKMVVASESDFQEAVQVCRKLDLTSRTNVLFSPVVRAHEVNAKGMGHAGGVDPAELADWILNSGLDARLQLQLHKILWPSDSRGR